MITTDPLTDMQQLLFRVSKLYSVVGNLHTDRLSLQAQSSIQTKQTEEAVYLVSSVCRTSARDSLASVNLLRELLAKFLNPAVFEYLLVEETDLMRCCCCCCCCCCYYYYYYGILSAR
jgi:hypothetical protein